MRFIASDFDMESWYKYGVEWLEKVKNKNCCGFIIDCGLPFSAYKLINDSNFEVHQLINKFDFLEFDKYYTLSSCIGLNQACIFVTQDFNFEMNLDKFLDNPDKLTCTLDDKAVKLSICYPIINLTNRVKFSTQINMKVVDKYGYLLSEKIMGGSKFAWNSFMAFYYLLLDGELVELRPGISQLALNLYASETEYQVETISLEQV